VSGDLELGEVEADQQLRGRMSMDHTCVSGGASMFMIVLRVVGGKEAPNPASGGLKLLWEAVEVVKSTGRTELFSSAVRSSEKLSHLEYVSVPHACFLAGLAEAAAGGEWRRGVRGERVGWG
jgi:hypothetical protein